MRIQTLWAILILFYMIKHQDNISKEGTIVVIKVVQVVKISQNDQL